MANKPSSSSPIHVALPSVATVLSALPQLLETVPEHRAFVFAIYWMIGEGTLKFFGEGSAYPVDRTKAVSLDTFLTVAGEKTPADWADCITTAVPGVSCYQKQLRTGKTTVSVRLQAPDPSAVVYTVAE